MNQEAVLEQPGFCAVIGNWLRRLFGCNLIGIAGQIEASTNLVRVLEVTDDYRTIRVRAGVNLAGSALAGGAAAPASAGKKSKSFTAISVLPPALGVVGDHARRLEAGRG